MSVELKAVFHPTSRQGDCNVKLVSQTSHSGLRPTVVSYKRRVNWQWLCPVCFH